MNCYDENFEPVKDHDASDPIMELFSIDQGMHSYRCALCSRVKVLDIQNIETEYAMVAGEK